MVPFISFRQTVLPLAAALSLLAPASARAQVGHPPDRSPYRDIPKGHTVTPFGALFGGTGGRFGLAPHDGPLYGLRYDIRTSSAIQLGVGVARGTLDRLIVDPFVELDNRVSGPVDQTVTFVEADLQLNLTGGKTWHRLAPFAAVGGGLTFPTSTPADTSGFELGKKIYFVPHAGFRFFLTDRIHLRTDARVIFWKLNYPASFTREPTLDPDSPPVIDDGRVSEWTTTSWLQAGLGFSFSP
ncbi:MAG TPA: hypothetical protein VG500_04805 [Gemmatimonadales bacterium]|jgi:hypothetical protein|nr:hypothetical protein [Gemmatimonadales bacterium]